MALYFITSNAGKFREIKAILPDVEQLNLELDEIQSLDPQVVIEHKLAQAATHHDGEFIVEDTSLLFACLNGLPGTYLKWFKEQLGNDGMAGLVARYDDHAAVAKATIGYRDSEGRDHYFTGEVTGEIVSPRGGIETFGWNPIFQPAGETRTFAEMTIAEKNALSMRGIAARKLVVHLTA